MGLAGGMPCPISRQGTKICAEDGPKTAGAQERPETALIEGGLRDSHTGFTGGYVSEAAGPQCVDVRGARPAMRHKDLGIWQTWTWAQMLDEVPRLRGRLARARAPARRQDRHHRRQPPAPLLGDAAPARALGAVPVPVYADCGRRRDGLRARARRGEARRRARTRSRSTRSSRSPIGCRKLAAHHL